MLKLMRHRNDSIFICMLREWTLYMQMGLSSSFFRTGVRATNSMEMIKWLGMNDERSRSINILFCAQLIDKGGRDNARNIDRIIVKYLNPLSIAIVTHAKRLDEGQIIPGYFKAQLTIKYIFFSNEISFGDLLPLNRNRIRATKWTEESLKVSRCEEKKAKRKVKSN